MSMLHASSGDTYITPEEVSLFEREASIPKLSLRLSAYYKVYSNCMILTLLCITLLYRELPLCDREIGLRHRDVKQP